MERKKSMIQTSKLSNVKIFTLKEYENYLH